MKSYKGGNELTSPFLCAALVLLTTTTRQQLCWLCLNAKPCAVGRTSSGKDEINHNLPMRIVHKGAGEPGEHHGIPGANLAILKMQPRADQDCIGLQKIMSIQCRKVNCRAYLRTGSPATGAASQTKPKCCAQHKVTSKPLDG